MQGLCVRGAVSLEGRWRVTATVIHQVPSQCQARVGTALPLPYVTESRAFSPWSRFARKTQLVVLACEPDRRGGRRDQGTRGTLLRSAASASGAVHQ